MTIYSNILVDGGVTGLSVDGNQHFLTYCLGLSINSKLAKISLAAKPFYRRGREIW
jgi:hypothetical protein